MSRISRLIAATGLAVLVSVGAAATAHAAGTAGTGPEVIGWDSVQAASPYGGEVIGWDSVQTGDDVIGWD
ncbi:hypothetical protein ABZ135_07940 [Streptomyces sp. NPDC006339]|uniref:hypothetical protein n=1 Tax=Streptomyces sp. NPDC006339 TaxID=3156755 RepID=UPI0033B47D41